MKLEAGAWVIFDLLSTCAGRVLYVDKSIVVVELIAGGTSMTGRSAIEFVGNYEKVKALYARIEKMSARKAKLQDAHRKKIKRLDDDNRIAVQKLLKKSK